MPDVAVCDPNEGSSLPIRLVSFVICLLLFFDFIFLVRVSCDTGKLKKNNIYSFCILC